MRVPRPRLVGIVLGIVLLLGTFLRLFEYFRNRPLWLDETMLALGVGRRGYLGLLAELDYDQTAPLLFLWALKTASLLGGMGEYSLRMLPLLAGVALPWVVWRMVRALGGTTAGLIAASLAALSVPLIYYSAEVKPYGVDALASASLILLTLRTREAPEQSSRWWQLLVAGLLGGLLSIPFPLVITGAVAALVLDPRVRALPGAGQRLGGLIGTWLVWFGLLYWLAYRDMGSLYLHRFWAGTFLDPAAPDLSYRVYEAASALLDPLPPYEGIVPLRWGLLLIGAAIVPVIRRAGAAGACLVVVPILALISMSVLGKYPIGSRLLIFLTPCVFALAGTGVAALLRLVRIREPAAALVGVLMIAAWSGSETIGNVEDPGTRKGGRESARRVLRSDPAEPVYILPGGIPTWSYYSTDWSRPDTTRLDYFAGAAVSTGPSALNGLVEEAPGGLRHPSIESSTGRTEVIGRRSGIAYREPTGFDQGQADSGWAGEEVSRIAEVARPYAWVYGVHWVDRLVPALRAEFARRGIEVVETTSDLSAVALRIRVP